MAEIELQLRQEEARLVFLAVAYHLGRPGSELDPITKQPVEHGLAEAARDLQPQLRLAVATLRLGDAQVSLVPLSGANAEVVVTVAWDISWYQYRISFDASQPVKLAERGYELDELEARFRAWNGFLETDGRITPDIPRL